MYDSSLYETVPSAHIWLSQSFRRHSKFVRLTLECLDR